MTRALLARELRVAFAGGHNGLPVGFFLLAAALFAFAVGPDARLLGAIGGGVLWVAALLAALLPVDRLVEPDRADGTLDQHSVRGIAAETLVAVKIAAHWLSFALPLLVAVLPAAALLQMSGAGVRRLLLSLLVGTPGLAALGVLAAALTAGLKSTAALAGLLVLPLAVPLLIFGAGALQEEAGGALRLLGAVSLLYVAAAPFAGGAAIRALRE